MPRTARPLSPSVGVALTRAKASSSAEAFAGFSQRDAQVVRGHGDKYALRSGRHLQAFARSREAQMAFHPGLLAVLEEACTASTTTHSPHGPLPGLNSLEAAERNTRRGRADLASAAPQSDRKERTMLRRSQSVLAAEEIGSVVALPCGTQAFEQALHVDSEHLFEHCHLPPHNVALSFLPRAGCVSACPYVSC